MTGERTSTSDGGQPDSSADAATAAGGDSLFAPSIREFPWPGAVLAGATAFLAQYVLVGLLFLLGPLSTRADGLLEQLTTYAFVVFGAHHVPVLRTAQGITFEGARRVNLVTDAQDPTIPTVVYLALPVVTLVIAGAIFYWRYGDGVGEDYERAVLTGMGQSVGYLLVGLVASFVFVATMNFDPGTVTEAVDRFAAFVSLLVYPLAFATAGALLVVGYRRYVG